MPTDWATCTAHTNKTKRKKGRRSHSIHRKTYPQYLLNFYGALFCWKKMSFSTTNKLLLCSCVSNPLLVSLSLSVFLFVLKKPLYFAARIHLMLHACSAYSVREHTHTAYVLIFLSRALALKFIYAANFAATFKLRSAQCRAWMWINEVTLI